MTTQPKEEDEMKIEFEIPEEGGMTGMESKIKPTSILDYKNTYGGIPRKYPRQTFNSGGKGNIPEVVHELNEISQYIDYSVFSKNQLRFAEKLVKTKTYFENETYIRSPNFFISLNKPRYWNINNYMILEKNINLVFDIMKEMIEDIPVSYASDITDKVKDLCDGMSSWLNHNHITNVKFSEGILSFIDLKGIMGELGLDNTYEDFISAGLFSAIYNKVVSIITYLNPYVQAKKDAGVNTMIPPVTSLDNIVTTERNYGERTYKDILLNSTATVEENIKSKSARTLEDKISVPQDRTSTTKTKVYTANSYYKIYAFPLYSLNILLPVKLMPTAFVTTTKFGPLINIIKDAKLAGSIMRIPISSILSKLIMLNKTGNRVFVNLKIKKNKTTGNNEVSVNATTGDVYNLAYFRKVMGIKPMHYIEGTQIETDKPIKSIKFDGKALIASSVNEQVLKQAKDLLPKFKNDETDLKEFKTINNEYIKSDTSKYYEKKQKSLRQNLIANNAYRTNNEYLVVTKNNGIQKVGLNDLKPYKGKNIIQFCDGSGNIVFVYDPDKHNFDL